MENASRALTIAAGMLLAILVTSLVIFGWGRITRLMSERQASKLVEDQAKFNAQLESYNRLVRGSDIVSLSNKINDLNAVMSEADKFKDPKDVPMENGRFTDTDFRKIHVLIQLKSQDGTQSRLPGDNIEQPSYSTCGKYTIVEIANNKKEYGLNQSDINKIEQALRGQGYIYDLSEYMAYFNGESYQSQYDYATIKDEKKAINDYYFTCKDILYDNNNGRIHMLLMKQVDSTATEFE